MPAIFGQCPLCPKNERPQRLYGGYCQFHFRSGKITKKIVKEAKSLAKKELERLEKQAKRKN